MKKQLIPAIVLIILSVIVIIGTQSSLSACVHEDGTFAPCHWAGQALLGLGCAAVGDRSACALRQPCAVRCVSERAPCLRPGHPDAWHLDRPLPHEHHAVPDGDAARHDHPVFHGAFVRFDRRDSKREKVKRR